MPVSGKKPECCPQNYLGIGISTTTKPITQVSRTGHITYDKILTMALTLQRRHSSVLPKPQPYSTVVISRDALHDCGMTLERVSYSTRTHSMPSLLEEFAKYQNKTAEHL